MKYTEDTLVQRTTADYLHDQLGWDAVYAYNDEDFGPESLLGRKSDREVVLTRYLRAALVKLKRNVPYVDAFGVELTADSGDRVFLTADFDFKAANRDVTIEFLPAK